MAQWLADNLLTIIMILAGIGGSWYALQLKVQKVEGRVSSTEKEITRSLGHHTDHFEKLGEIEKDISKIGQKLHSHIEEDNRQFIDLKELVKENRDLTFKVLDHLRNNGGSK